MTIVILRKVEALRPARPAIRKAGLFRIVGLLSRGGFGEIAPSEFMRHLEAQKQGVATEWLPPACWGGTEGGLLLMIDASLLIR